MNKIYIEHPYWGACTAEYIKPSGSLSGCVAIHPVVGGTFGSKYYAEELNEDHIIQHLDQLEEEQRYNTFKLLLKSTLNEFEGLVHQGSIKGSEELVAKAQLAQKIIDLLDLDL